MKRSTSFGAVAAIVAISLVGVATVAPPPAAASMTASTAPFNATITTPVGAFSLGCCHTFIGVAATSVAIPRVGRATVSGSIETCGSSIFSPCPERNGTTLSLVFSTPSGDTLTLGGYNPIGEPLTWSVVGGTGRFAGASGSGSYTYNVASVEDHFLVTIALSGTFQMRQ